MDSGSRRPYFAFLRRVPFLRPPFLRPPFFRRVAFLLAAFFRAAIWLSPPVCVLVSVLGPPPFCVSFAGATRARPRGPFCASSRASYRTRSLELDATTDRIVSGSARFPNSVAHTVVAAPRMCQRKRRKKTHRWSPSDALERCSVERSLA